MGLSDLEEFRNEVGTTGSVCVKGGGTRWDVGGEVGQGVRVVSAPSGIDAYDPAEMTVLVGAGTTLTALAEVLAEHRQEVALAGPVGSTVGGALAVGWNSIRRQRVGFARDALLQAECVGADGKRFKAGGPTVKNASGYELCRLLVGSLGTLALMGRVILRTTPIPEWSLWLRGSVTPADVVKSCYRPASILWDGSYSHVCLEGYEADIQREASALIDSGMVKVQGPPSLPPHRNRLTGDLPEGAILDVAIGVAHCPEAAAIQCVDPAVKCIADRMKANFDPHRRLNPNRDPYSVPA